jgi:hypothetical protein
VKSLFLNERGEGRRGAKFYDNEKARSSINHSMLSGERGEGERGRGRRKVWQPRS